MAGTPGYPWPPYPMPSTHEGESQRAQLEAGLRMLREQRPLLAAEIGEYLYSLVIQGQMRDPLVLATCRRLYDHEQQVLHLEANLRALPAASPAAAPIYVPVPPIPSNPPPGPIGGSNDDSATVIQRPSTGSHDAQPSLRPADLDSSESVIAPVRRPEPVTPGGGKTTERRCGHCRMPLRANDTTCPVCGRPAGEQPAQAAQCRRCGTDLRSQDPSCPVCGTPRS